MAPIKKIAKRQIALRNSLWPGLDEDRLWSRHMYNGFTTIPKAMPLIMNIMEDLSGNKHVALAYLELWCRTFDDSFVVLSKQQEIAFHSGVGGQRGVSTWKKYLKSLADLGFISLAPGPSGDCSYALIFNPYLVIKDHYDKKKVEKDKYNSLLARASDVSDDSLKS